MFDHNAADDTLLSEVRSHFEQSLEHDAEAVEWWHSDSRMYHNTRGVGQWDPDDLAFLKEMKRPALTFNLIKGKIDTFLGLHKDAKLKARVAPVGDDDRFLADVYNALLDRVYALGEHEQAESDLMQIAAVTGQASMAITVEDDPDNPLFKRVSFEAIHPFEQAWDSGCVKPHDSSFYFWFRWLDKSEFTIEFPEQRHRWDELRALAGDEASTDAWSEASANQYRSAGSSRDEDRDYDGGTEWSLYYDRERTRIRVIQCEYDCPVQRHFAIDPATGEARRVSKEEATISGQRVMTTWANETYGLQFIGNEILWREQGEKDALPFEGFSNDRFCFYWDWESGHPYGLVRNQADPQREVNKSKSQEIELLNAQGRPGYIGEEGAVDDPEQFEADCKRAGGYAVAKKGALTGGMLEMRPPPQISPGVVQRMATSLEMLDRVSGIEPDPGNPAAHAEAAATVQIRDHKSKLAHQNPLETFQRCQKSTARKTIQTIAKMEDAQITQLLASHDRYRVADGIVIEVRKDPETGQMMPVPDAYAPIGDVKAMPFNVELEVASENTVRRNMELMQLLEAMAAGAPVAPEMVAERLGQTRADRERLKTFAEEQAQAQTQAAERESQQAEAQMVRMLQIEEAKNAETSRHNLADEALTGQDNRMDFAAKMAAVLERADAGEKAQIQALMAQVQQRQIEREKLLASVQRPIGANAS